MIRYEVESCKRAGPRDLWLLERAFGRVAAQWKDRVTRTVVSAPSGYVLVVMDFVGPPEDANRDCEHLYAIAWYDAFGVWGSTHVGRIVEEGNRRVRRPSASRTARSSDRPRWPMEFSAQG